jgi:hypothetical protein
MALGLLKATASTNSGFFLDKVFFLSFEFWDEHQLVSELMSSKLKALCLLKATASTGIGFFLINIFVLLEFWGDHGLVSKLLSS